MVAYFLREQELLACLLYTSKLGKHGEINHTVFVLRERAFGRVVLPDNLFRVGNGLFNRKLSETLVPFLQCRCV